jgi:hypothetical protein
MTGARNAQEGAIDPLETAQQFWRMANRFDALRKDVTAARLAERAIKRQAVASPKWGSISNRWIASLELSGGFTKTSRS